MNMDTARPAPAALTYGSSEQALPQGLAELPYNYSKTPIHERMATISRWNFNRETRKLLIQVDGRWIGLLELGPQRPQEAMNAMRAELLAQDDPQMSDLLRRVHETAADLHDGSDEDETERDLRLQGRRREAADRAIERLGVLDADTWLGSEIAVLRHLEDPWRFIQGGKLQVEAVIAELRRGVTRAGWQLLLLKLRKGETVMMAGIFNFDGEMPQGAEMLRQLHHWRSKLLAAEAICSVSCELGASARLVFDPLIRRHGEVAMIARAEELAAVRAVFEGQITHPGHFVMARDSLSIIGAAARGDGHFKEPARPMLEQLARGRVDLDLAHDALYRHYRASSDQALPSGQLGHTRWLVEGEGGRWQVWQPDQGLQLEDLSGRMDHCVRGYASQILQGRSLVFQLDAEDRSDACTLEVALVEGRQLLWQAKRRFNERPGPRLSRAVRAWAEHSGVDWLGCDDLADEVINLEPLPDSFSCRALEGEVQAQLNEPSPEATKLAQEQLELARLARIIVQRADAAERAEARRLMKIARKAQAQWEGMCGHILEARIQLKADLRA